MEGSCNAGHCAGIGRCSRSFNIFQNILANLQTSLTGLEDEDQQMDGERLAEDAKDSVPFLAAFTEVKSQQLNSKF